MENLHVLLSLQTNKQTNTDNEKKYHSHMLHYVSSNIFYKMILNFCFLNLFVSVQFVFGKKPFLKYTTTNIFFFFTSM